MDKPDSTGCITNYVGNIFQVILKKTYIYCLLHNDFLRIEIGSIVHIFMDSQKNTKQIMSLDASSAGQNSLLVHTNGLII